MSERPKVGVGAIMLRNGLVLVGKRLGSHGSGTWTIPGGHLEFGESFIQCAEREVLEETGLRLANPRFSSVSNGVMEGKQYVTVTVVADCPEGEPRETTDKLVEFKWIDPREPLPEPFFDFARTSLSLYLEGRVINDF
ncbi:ADP-ribose pyrophosphatase [Candidatus Micrarchaeota archaeon CG09_land_8_20_14_0_10_60_16]|nr:MAG: ADP-ribose pyrophosphatase [Candidatus Micrarchaeota archaeon CG09_land_8_20_14_0_10_60_16]